MSLTTASYDEQVSQHAVEVVDLKMRYGTTTAVDGLSLSVEAGTVTAILGPNGAGKTTTIETCEGFRVPQSGSVRVLGLDPILDAKKLRPRVGVMLQDGGLPAQRFNMVIPVRGGNDNNLSGHPNTPDDNLMRCLLR